MEPAERITPLRVVADAMDADPDEAYLFKMSPASAEQVTIQICSMLERAWEYIAIAYQGRAYLALGYQSWDEYVDDRLGDLRLTVPREKRAQAVAALSDANMSLRAIAKVLGVSPATAYRDLAGAELEPDGAAEDAVAIGVRGRDGKQYPKRKKCAEVACALCGESHPTGMQVCPWDLFAQGRGPRPVPVAEPAERDRRDRAEPPELTPTDTTPPPLKLVPTRSIVEGVTRAVCIVDELDCLPQLVDQIEAARGSPNVADTEAGLATSIRELIEHLRIRSETMARLVQRLERLSVVAD